MDYLNHMEDMNLAGRKMWMKFFWAKPQPKNKKSTFKEKKVAFFIEILKKKKVGYVSMKSSFLS